MTPLSSLQENIREQQRQVWNEFSSGWQKQDAFVLAWLAPIAEVLLDTLELKDGDHVLDVSTGRTNWRPILEVLDRASGHSAGVSRPECIFDFSWGLRWGGEAIFYF